MLGAAVGTAVSVLLAPRSGPELQGAARDRLEEARRAGDEAELLETERLKREFRVAVNDPTALTGKFDHPDGAARPHPAEETEQAKALRAARERQEAADKAKREVAKTEREARQARQEADQRQQEAVEARREAERTS